MNFNNCIIGLKNTARTGWMQRGVPSSIAESVAEHSYHAAMIAGLIASKLNARGVRVDLYKAMAIAVIHDTPECVIGDIPLYIQRECKEVLDCKKKVEVKAFEDIVGGSRDLVELYLEWSRESSIEAIIARVSDKLSTLIQACEYYKTGYARVIEIAESCLNSIKKYFETVNGLEDIVREILRPYLSIFKKLI